MKNKTVQLLTLITLCAFGFTAVAADGDRDAALKRLEEYYGEVSIRTIAMTLNPRSPDDLRLFLSTGIPADAKLELSYGDQEYEVSLINYTLEFSCDNEATADVIQVLVDGGADPNEPHPTGGDAPLLRVTGCHRIVGILLDAGADPNVTNEYGHTPLRKAMNQFGEDESVRLLIEGGADVHGDRERLLKLAKSSNATSTKKRLIEEALSAPPPKKLEPRDFRKAVGERDVKVVRTYLGKDPSAAFTPYNNAIPLITLVTRCTDAEDGGPVLEILNLLLENGADVNAVGGAMKETALHPAARQCQADVVKVLLGAGANVEAKNLAEQTPLFLAVMANRPGAVEVLLDAGAKVDKTTKFIGNSKPEIKPLLKKKRK